MSQSNSPQDVTIVDAASLFEAAEVLAERFGRHKITIDYSRLKEQLDAFREEVGWRPASMTSILLSYDPKSEGQKRFLSMLQHAGFEPDTCHFRDAFASLPPGRAPAEQGGRSPVSFSARIAYIAGLLARHEAPNFMVVSHSFELCAALSDLARRTRGRVGIAYFNSLLDYRWKFAGLGQQDKCDIEFFDLDECGEYLLGIDLMMEEQREQRTPATSSGLSRF